MKYGIGNMKNVRLLVAFSSFSTTDGVLVIVNHVGISK